ncbi:conjugative transposon protein TraM [Arachidicoccus soli]|uniref:Conjugative transposon protein TraM n=1 Tax=Arachidicoccus soli TaxID=2341117 RepID=A0A386HU50_9BACT|nr:conjugative transposon protein TraM [Arachidicoccus soli]AYD49031.1 conjugative transposon protein TraM [Arachidicoccus soli]
MKINFRHPKYIVPLITVPFLIIGFFIFGGKMKASPAKVPDIQHSGMNTSMPGVDTAITKAQIKDKFDAYQQAFKQARDATTMTDIQGNVYSDNQLGDEGQNTTGYSQRNLDSLTSVLNKKRALINRQLETYNPNNDHFDESDESVKYPQNDYVKNNIDNKQNLSDNNKNNTNNVAENIDPASYNNQMRVFKDQMHYLDSIQKERGGNETSNDKRKETKDQYAKSFEEKSDSSLKLLHISTVKNNTGQSFNTVSDFNKENNDIPAMIDEDVKATLGSRVRIRLLKDIYAGDYLIKKGTYLYGVVTGFQKQRVNISIAQIMYNNVSLHVKMDVFDNDGYLGLYVPGSNFREFTKDIGSQASQGLSQVVTPDNSDVKTNLLAGLFNTTTTTLSNLLKKDKAFLKYNYIVFLQEDNTAKNN